MPGEGPDRSGLAVLVDPETVLDHAREVVLDAGTARLLQTDAPQRTEDRQRKVDFSVTDPTGVEFRSAYAVAADVRRPLRLADRADDRGRLRADHPLAQG